MTKFNAMRSISTSISALISALGLLITLCGSADAATVRHIRTYHHHHVTSGFAGSLAYEPARPPVHEYAPRSDVPASAHEEGSTYGGVPLLPDD